jgi:dTDP-4-dehydrorhamnose reductase
MKIIITGGKGQLGIDCHHVLRRDHEVMAIDLEDIDITHLSDVEATVQHFAPNIIVNCAAYTQVDACETHRELAWKANVEGPRNLASAVEKYGGRLVHISTDYVFDGRKTMPDPYLEEDEPGPLSYYGKTKLEGELAVRETTDGHVILRTAWMYGLNGHNILKTFLKLALGNPGGEIKVVNDQFGSPTWSYRLALQIAKVIEVNGQGTYHATSEGYCTWYELACRFLEKMGVPHKVIPCTSKEYPTPASRPKNSVLENRRLKNEGINLMPQWEDDLDRFVHRFRELLLEEVKG